MRRLTSWCRRFVSDERGLETVEYAIIAALITITALLAITAVGTGVTKKFAELAGKLGETVSP